jgi:hypothetical protein
LPELSVRIGGVRVRLRGRDATFLAAARRRYRTFLSAGKAEVDLALETVARPLRRRMDEPRVEGDRVERHDFELGPGTARVLWTPSALDGLLRVVVGLALAERGGFLCHAAAFDGRLLPGRSGAGKSTLGRKTPRDRLLADELVGVVGSTLHSTPFWGDFRAGRENGTRRLRSIVLLDRTAPRGVRRVPKARGLAALLECAVVFRDGPGDAERILRAARRLVDAVPVFELSYDAAATSFRALEAMLAEAGA